MTHLQTCSFCKAKVYKLVTGFCMRCYKRNYHNGTPDYKDRVRNTCSVVGCTTFVASHGYCAKHYRRLKIDGDPLSERVERWGHKRSHPLIHAWKSMRRKGIDATWKEDFWNFLRDVGDRPTQNHQLKRLDSSQPFGPDNWKWHEIVIPMAGTDKAAKAAYARAHRARFPEKHRGYDLRNKTGISSEEYEALLHKQGGKCAVCGDEEVSPNRSTGKPYALAVDHCHDTKKVRGLLCCLCNRGIGLFKDDPKRLQLAAAYLLERQ